jgi:hypothetical protein
VSQLFDSLRRGRPSQTSSRTLRTAQGDAVLATLGYAPVPRHVRARSTIILILILAAVLALIWTGWQVYSRWPTPAPPASTAARSNPAAPGARGRDPGTTGIPSTATATPPLSAAPAPGPSPAAPRSVPDPETPRPEPPSEGVRVARAEPLDSPVPALARDRPKAPSPRSPAPLPVTRAESGAQAPPRGTSEANDLALALYYHRAGDFENALQHYRALLQRNNLGLLYQEKKLLTESAGELSRAVLIEPGNVLAHNNYGVTLLLQGRADEAAAQFRTALTLDPRNVDALVNLALAQRDGRQPEVAKETLLEALTISPRSAAAHYNLAQLYDQTSEAARAVDHYRKFLEYAGAEYASRAAAVRARVDALSRIPE